MEIDLKALLAELQSKTFCDKLQGCHACKQKFSEFITSKNSCPRDNPKAKEAYKKFVEFLDGYLANTPESDISFEKFMELINGD